MNIQVTEQQLSFGNSSRLSESLIVAPDTKVSSKSIFADHIWHMEALVTTPGISNYYKSWDFSKVTGFPYGFALSLAEYAYARLYTPVITRDREVVWMTVHNELLALNEFIRFCESQDLKGFDEVDATLCEKYLKVIQLPDDKGKQKSDDRIRTIIKSIYLLWEYSSTISHPFLSQPFSKPIEKLLKKKSYSTENATPVIPEPVFAAMTSAALDYVQVYSPVIIDTWHALQIHWDKQTFPPNKSCTTQFRMLTKAFKDISITKKSYWRVNEWSKYSEVYNELQQLRAACTIVVLAFSGIRSSELLALEAGCYTLDERENGLLRYYINTMLHKHKGHGSRDTWVVIEVVVNAIKILELLTEKVRTATNDNRLMLTDGSNSFFSVQNNYIGAEMHELSMEAIVVQIQAFQNHCNKHLNRAPIPQWLDENGENKKWQFNTRQFRRTLARYIARQPFGVIAGMIQYKHVGVAIFEGYAGTEPAWNKMLEEEKMLASVNILEEVAMDLSNGQLAGDFGIKLKEDFASEFRGRAEDFPPSQIAKWLAHSNKNLFVGKFNFCFFDPTKALCTKGSNETNRPVLNFCQPDKCSNACVGKRHAPLWKAQLNQAEELSMHPKVTEVQREVLQREASSLRIVVTNLEANG